MKLRATVKPDKIDGITKNDDFILAIQLSRVVNGLRSNFRSILGVSNDKKLIETKDRVDLLLIHGSMLYEAVNIFVSYNKRFITLDVFEKERAAFKEIQKQYGDKKSFKNTVLERIRNKLFFHFDQEVVPRTLSKMPFDDGITFLRASSTNNKDILYTLSDDIVLSYLTDYDETKRDGVKIYQDIEKKIIELSKLLGELIDKIIAELLKDTLEVIKS
jgi:hypothetical protein